MLNELVGDEIAGDPESGRCWIRRSLSTLQAEMSQQGYRLSRETIRRLLRKGGVSPRSNVKRLNPHPHPARDRQFRYIQEQRYVFECLGWPVISVDTKKKELIGPFYHAGQVWCRKGEAVYTHDFPSDALGKAIPYGVYDVQANDAHIYVGQSADTPEFAVDAIRHWWTETGQHRYPAAPALLILADSGGSNGYRPRLFKQQLQVKLADAFGLVVTVTHYPTGASKWNPIEHRVFSQITRSWAGIPLTSWDRVLDGIRHTTTATGLQVQATLMETVYQTGIKVSDNVMRALCLDPHALCPHWNYTFSPRL